MRGNGRNRNLRFRDPANAGRRFVQTAEVVMLKVEECLTPQPALLFYHEV